MELFATIIIVIAIAAAVIAAATLAWVARFSPTAKAVAEFNAEAHYYGFYAAICSNYDGTVGVYRRTKDGREYIGTFLTAQSAICYCRTIYNNDRTLLDMVW